jgi:hypothetical protein
MKNDHENKVVYITEYEFLSVNHLLLYTLIILLGMPLRVIVRSHYFMDEYRQKSENIRTDFEKYVSSFDSLEALEAENRDFLKSLGRGFGQPIERASDEINRVWLRGITVRYLMLSNGEVYLTYR